MFEWIEVTPVHKSCQTDLMMGKNVMKENGGKGEGKNNKLYLSMYKIAGQVALTIKLNGACKFHFILGDFPLL